MDLTVCRNATSARRAPRGFHTIARSAVRSSGIPVRGTIPHRPPASNAPFGREGHAHAGSKLKIVCIRRASWAHAGHEAGLP
ncbi:hypothetical protein GOD00_24295 [Sinorhizobium medicae]|nr:hypothetical protein [Sinorhizobium medicae]